MGFLFFGRKYNRKTFEKNTALFRERVEAMLEGCHDLPGAGSALNKVLFALEVQGTCPKPMNAEQMEEIDRRIFGYLEKSEAALSAKHPETLSACAELTVSVLQISRCFGREPRFSHEIAYEEKRAELIGEIDALTDQRAALEKEMDELVEQGLPLRDDDPRRAVLSAEYDMRKSEYERVSRRLAEARHMMESTFAQDEHGDCTTGIIPVPERLISPEELADKLANMDLARRIMKPGCNTDSATVTCQSCGAAVEWADRCPMCGAALPNGDSTTIASDNN